MAEENLITQENFVCSPYTEESWEVIGEAPREQEFSAFEVPVISSAQFQRDPIFRDFGGSGESKSTLRWHLPDDQAMAMEKGDEEPEEVGVKFSDEEVAQIRQEAFQAGKTEALAEAEQLRSHEMAGIAEKFEGILKDLQAQFNEQAVLLEQAALTLCLDISDKIIGHAVEINPEYIIKILRDALKQSGGATIKRVRVSPQDMEFIEVVGVQDKISEFVGGWKFEGDPSIRSGCVVESSAGEIDYQLDKAWNRIKDAIMKVKE